MALQLGALRDALLSAGAPQDKADKAAEEAAGYDTDLRILKWGQTAIFAVLLFLLGSQAGLWFEFARVNSTLARLSTQLEQSANKK